MLYNLLFAVSVSRWAPGAALKKPNLSGDVSTTLGNNEVIGQVIKSLEDNDVKVSSQDNAARCRMAFNLQRDKPSRLHQTVEVLQTGENVDDK